MCELLVDDLSLLNSEISDSDVGVLGTDSGFTLGNAKSVHAIANALLTNDDPDREHVLPIKITGNRAARAAQAAKIHRALQNPEKVTLKPCDGWGADAWWTILRDYDGKPVAHMDIVSDDYRATHGDEQRYTITLGVDAWAKSIELHTVTGTNAIADLVLWSAATGGATGWAAVNGTLDPGSGTSYVGALSDGSASTSDALRHATMTWNPSGYTLLRVEAKINSGSGPGGDDIPWVYAMSHGVGGSTFVPVTSLGPVSVESLGSGWYAVTVALNYGLPALEGLQIQAYPGAAEDTDLKIRKVTLQAVNTNASGAQTLWLDVPGSAPAAGDISVDHASAGVLVYTAPAFTDHPQYDPLVGTGGPEGTYHLIVDYNGGTATEVTWTVGDQSGTVTLADLFFSSAGFLTLAHDIYLPEGGATVTITPTSGTFNTNKTFLLFVENRLTGQTGAYSILDAPGGGASTTFTIAAPTPARPVTTWLVDGTPVNDLLRAADIHDLRPGLNRVLAAWHGSSTPAGAAVTWSGYPAFHTDVVPPDRWWET